MEKGQVTYYSGHSDNIFWLSGTFANIEKKPAPIRVASGFKRGRQIRTLRKPERGGNVGRLEKQTPGGKKREN